MRRGAVAALFLLIATACDRLADPVTAAVFFGPAIGGDPVDIKGNLPPWRVEAMRVLAGFGFEIDPKIDPAAISAASAIAESLFHVPDVARSEDARVRLYLSKSFSDSHGGEGYGVIVDLDEDDRIVTAVGFKLYALFF